MLQDQLLPQRCIAGRCGLESENSKARPGYSGALVSFRAVLGADRVRGYHMLCLIRSGAQFAKQQAGSLVCEWTIRSLKPRDYGLSIYLYVLHSMGKVSPDCRCAQIQTPAARLMPHCHRRLSVGVMVRQAGLPPFLPSLPYL